MPATLPQLEAQRTRVVEKIADLSDFRLGMARFFATNRRGPENRRPRYSGLAGLAPVNPVDAGLAAAAFSRTKNPRQNPSRRRAYRGQGCRGTTWRAPTRYDFMACSCAITLLAALTRGEARSEVSTPELSRSFTSVIKLSRLPIALLIFPALMALMAS